MNIQEMLKMTAIELADFFIDNYTFEVPEDVNAETSQLLSNISNAYTFIQSLLMYAQIDVRTKRRTSTKTDIEDAIDKRDAIETFRDLLKHQYSAVSRLVSVKQQTIDEAKFIGGG